MYNPGQLKADMAEFLAQADDADISRGLALMQEFREMQHLYGSAIKEITTKLEVLDGEFKTRYDHNPIHHIESRQKEVPSIIRKLKRKGLPITLTSMKEAVHDMAGVRVVCNYRDDIYVIAKMLAEQNDLRLIRTRDYIEHPKPNGYRSLHLIVTVPVFLTNGPVETPVEIQIRTIAMDLWASLEHQLQYKSDAPMPDELLCRLAECAQTCEKLDTDMQDIYQANLSRYPHL